MPCADGGKRPSPQRGSWSCTAALVTHQSQCLAPLSTFQRPARSEGHLGGRGRQPLSRPHDVQQPAARAASVGTGAGSTRRPRAGIQLKGLGVRGRSDATRTKSPPPQAMRPPISSGLRWYQEAERELPPPAPVAVRDFMGYLEALEGPRDFSFFYSYCLRKLGRQAARNQASLKGWPVSW